MAVGRQALSVVIPAHNESAVITRCLRSVFESTGHLQLDVIVVANGCTDDTVEAVEKFGLGVRLFQLSRGSKALALAKGDSECRFFPRVYLDADITVSRNALSEIAAELSSGSVEAAAPRVLFELSTSSWIVRRFYGFWKKTAYFRNAPVGSGFYALSEAGRGRFQNFYQGIADDGFVRRVVPAEHRRCLESCHFKVQGPRTVAALIAIKTRARLGDLQLDAMPPAVVLPRTNSRASLVRQLFADPVGGIVYCAVRLIAGLRAAKRFREGDVFGWDRDDTSR